MSCATKQTWVLLVAILTSTAFYLLRVLDRPPGQALVDTPYMWPLIWAVVATIVLCIVGSILIAIATAVPQGEADCRDEDFEPDERDKDIERRGEVVGYMVFSVGTLNALVLAFAEADHFWIGNTIFLSGALASVVSCVVKLVLDKRGF